MEIIDKTKLEDNFYRYLKKHWKGAFSRRYNELYVSKLHLRKVAFIHYCPKGCSYSNKPVDEIRLTIRKKFLDYKKLRNVLKKFDNEHKNIKITIELVFRFSY